jgi:hypothetical protein
MSAIGIPLATGADQTIATLAAITGSAAIARLDGATLLGERALLAQMKIPGQLSAGGGCQLFTALDDTVALNLARPADRELLPALFEADDLNVYDSGAIAAQLARLEAAQIVSRGRSMGLAIAAEHEAAGSTASDCVELVTGSHATTRARRIPRVVDLSALWAGPLAAHLLWLAGAEVVKVESATRPDAMRAGNNSFYALLNQGKASVVLDLARIDDRNALVSLISASDIVIEAARPRALQQLGIDADELVRKIPGLAWVTITGHGAVGEAADWVGFGDDCGVAGGLSAALRAATGRAGFVGDAMADPLTGLCAAIVAWRSWTSRRGGRFGLAMSRVVARRLAESREQDPIALKTNLIAWNAAVGQPFPTVNRRPIGELAQPGEHTRSYLAKLIPSKFAH